MGKISLKHSQMFYEEQVVVNTDNERRRIEYYFGYVYDSQTHGIHAWKKNINIWFYILVT